MAEFPNTEDKTDQGYHYTAHVEIRKVIHAVPAMPSSSRNSGTPAKDRRVHELADVVVRSSELHTLVEKLLKHVDLIEED